MEKTLFQSSLIKIGTFVLPTNKPEFHRYGYTENPLIVFPKNSIWIQHKNKDPFVADSSVINLYNKQQTYTRFPIDKKGDYCHWIELSKKILPQIKTSHCDNLFNVENIKCELTTYLLHHKLFKNIESSPQIDPLMIEDLAIEIVNNISKATNSRPTTMLLKPTHKKLTERIKKSIHSNISQNKSLNDIAKDVYSSPFHISRVFKQVTGMGINQFRTQIRLKSVYSEIKQGKNDLASLALDYGFSSHSHLSYSFKKYFNFTPSTLIINH